MIARARRLVVVHIITLVGVLGFSATALGHALQPGYLELGLIDEGLYAVVWKTPATNGRPMAITAQLPESCDLRTPRQPIWNGAAYVARWTASCPGGLEGGLIHIDGLDQTSTDDWFGSTSPMASTKRTA